MNRFQKLQTEVKRLRAIEGRLRNVQLSQAGWEENEDIVLLNGDPVGMTITKTSREFDRWWPAVQEFLLTGK